MVHMVLFIPFIFPDIDPPPKPVTQENDEAVNPAPNPDPIEAVEGEQEQGNIDFCMILASQAT